MSVGTACVHCDLPGSACGTLGMLAASLKLSKVTTDSLGFFAPFSVGVHELLRTGHSGDADHSPCSLLPAPQGLISGFLISQAQMPLSSIPFLSCRQ